MIVHLRELCTAIEHHVKFVQRITVYLNKCKEYFNMAIFKIRLLLLIKRWTFWHTACFPMLSHTGIVNSENLPSVLVNPVFTCKLAE